MWRARSLFAGILIAATGSVLDATTWTVRPVPRPEPSVYSGDIIRPIPRPGLTASDSNAELDTASIPPTTVAEQPKPLIAPLPEGEAGVKVTASNGLAEGEAELGESPDANQVADESTIETQSDLVPNKSADPQPELAGGPVFFRPVLRPEKTVAVMPEPELVVANVLVTSLRPKQRPSSLVVRAVAALKPAAPNRLPNPTLVAKPVPVPQPAIKPKPAAKPVPPAAPMRPADVVMVGDSITAGGRWSSRFPDVTIVNRGISGDTGLKILARMDGILATKPKTALVMFGINDIYNGVPVERILQRYDQIISILEAQRIKVVIQSTLACSGHICGEKLNQVYALNSGLLKIAKQRRLKYVDINKGLSDRTGLRRDYSRDGIHLNGEGYATWYTMLRPYIKS